MILNKKSQQTILMYGTNAEGQEAEGQIRFGQQLIDQFKPKTLIVEESPIQIERQEGYLDENSGLYYP